MVVFIQRREGGGAMQDQVTTNGSRVEGVGRDTLDPDAPRLGTILDEVRAQGARARRTQQGFAIFAVLAFVIALADLVVIAAKLQGNSTTTSARVVRTAGGSTAATSAGVGAAATKSGAVAPLAHTVGVKLAEYSVEPTVTRAAAGKVTFAVQNAGTVKHEFVVVKTNKPAGSLLSGARADESGNVGETGDLAPGQAKRLTLKLPPGHYALICNLPGHYAAGQHVDFTVR
jgi:uncharacterized cupredoxin-like copper-binding protein